MPAAAKTPVIVELYTSQGCGSCADAGELVDELAARDDLLPLTFSVDYWDYLGWTDTFARPEFSDRQRAYAQRWSSQPLYTPQVVVSGRNQARADEPDKVEALIDDAAADARHGAPVIRIDSGSVHIGPGRADDGGDDVWLIRYDPRGQDVPIRRGENQGRTLTYRNVVRELVNLGQWTGRSVNYDLPEPSEDGLVTLVLVQKPAGGEVLAQLER